MEEEAKKEDVLRSFVVSQDGPQRLDAAVSNHLHLSRATAHWLIQQKRVQLKEQILHKNSFRLKEGQLVQVSLPHTLLASLEEQTEVQEDATANNTKEEQDFENLMEDKRQHRLYARIKEEHAQHELVSEKQVFRPLLWKRWFEIYALRADKESLRCMRKVIFEKTRKACEKGYYLLSDGHKVELYTKNDHANADQQERTEDGENEEIKELKEEDEEEQEELQETEGDREATLIDFTGQLQQLNNGTRASDHRFKGRHCYRDPYTHPRTYEMIPEAKAEGVENTTKVSVIEMDSLEVAQRLLTKGYNPCTLIFSSNTFPSSKSGAEKSGGQEGSIYQRTNLYQILSKSEWEDQFPLPEFAAIYIPTLTILRSDEKQGCAFLKNPVQAACIVIAAYSRPKLLPSTSATPQGEPAMTMRFMDKTKTKMKVVLQVALDKGHDAVVLGAIGCGAFANPPMAVALLWKEVLASDFEGCFKRVIFAVLETGKRGHPNPTGNVRPFRRVFEDQDSKR